MVIKEKTKGRKKLISDYRINGNIENDKIVIPQIIAQVWSDHLKNITEIQKLLDYYYNKTDILEKVKVQRPDINNQIAIPSAFEIQRKINSYANGVPRVYTALDNEKQKLVQTFNNYQINECKHSKLQTANLYSSICGVGYYCVLPDYKENTNISSYEIFSDNFSPLNTFIVYENSLRGYEMLGVNYFTKTITDDKGKEQEVTEFNIFTKYHQWVFEALQPSQIDTYSIRQQQIISPTQNVATFVDAISQPFGIIPIVEVDYHPFRIGIFEIVIDLIDCANLFLSGDADARQQAVDYVMVMTDCEFEKKVDEDGNEIEPDIASKRLIYLKTNNNTTKAKVEILTNNFNSQTTIDFLSFLNLTIEKVVGMPTRKSQDVGGNSSTGNGSKNENGMRDLDDNADIIQSQALVSERKFIKLVLEIDKNSPSKELNGLEPIDIKVVFPRNELENILTSAQAYSTVRPYMNDEDALAFSRLTNDIVGTAERNKKYKEEQNNLEIEKEQKLADLKNINEKKVEDVFIENEK